jgi:serine/threonine-protein kinase
VPALSAAIVSDDPTPPSQLRADLPAELERIVLACLAKRPADRPQTVQDLATALAPFVNPGSQRHVERVLAIGGGASRPIALAASSGAFRALRETANAWGTTQQRRRITNRGIVMGVGAGVVLFVSLLLGVLVISKLRARPAAAEPDVASVSADDAKPVQPAIPTPTQAVAVPPSPVALVEADAAAAADAAPARDGSKQKPHSSRRETGPLDDRH